MKYFYLLLSCAVALAEIATDEGVLVLTEDNFQEAIDSNEFILVEFYAPWCGHCKKLEPIFKLVDQSLSGERDLRIGRVDCTRFPNVGREFSITGYPTILL